jgi:hypothetical protein
MVFDQDGTLKWAPENLIPYSNNFTGTGWSTQNGGSGVTPTITAGFAAGPDGVAGAATRIQCSLGSPTSDDISLVNYNAAITGRREVKVWAKLNTGTSGVMLLRIANTTTICNLTTQWQQFTTSDVTTNLNGNGLQMGLRMGATGPGPTSLDFLVAYAQEHRLPVVSTAYVPTSGSAYFGARFDYDPATLTPLGYLSEVQSTNAITSSQDFSSGWTSSNITLTNNAVVAPDGSTTAATMLYSTGTSLHQLSSTGSYSYSNTNVLGLSCFVKNITGSAWVQFTFGGNSGFNFQPSTGTVGSSLSGTQSNVQVRPCANGWYRLSFFFTAAATTSSAVALNFTAASNSTSAASTAGDGTSTVAVWGFQIDSNGVGVTSYIPTAGSSVTRSGDLLTLPMSSVPGWRPAVGGVLVVPFRQHTLTPSSGQTVVYISDALQNNSVRITATGGSDTRWGGDVISGGSSQFNFFTGRWAGTFVRRKAAISWSPTHGAVYADGTLLQESDGTYSLPVTPTTMYIGIRNSGELNGSIESIAYYAGAHSDSFTQRVSK